MSASADFLSTAINVGSALGGALVGGAFTLLGVDSQQRAENKRRKEEEIEAQRALLKALSTEMDTLLNAYMVNVGDDVDAVADDSYWDGTWDAATDYFVVYRANGGLLGRILNDVLRSSIISTYTTAMGLIESYRAYSGMVRAAWALEYEPERHTGITPDHWHLVKESFPALRAQHNLVKQRVSDMQSQIARALKA